MAGAHTINCRAIDQLSFSFLTLVCLPVLALLLSSPGCVSLQGTKEDVITSGFSLLVYIKAADLNGILFFLIVF